MSHRTQMLAIGTDYEVFVRPIDGDSIVSAIPLIPPGKEEDPIDFGICSIHHDNVLAEVNVVPEHEPRKFTSTVLASLNLLSNFLEQTGHTYVIKDSIIMPSSELRRAEALEFGCVPDYDVVTCKENEVPSAWLAGNHRTAGGHIHVSYTFSDRKQYLDTALLLSTVLSLGTTVMGDSSQRRELYGKAHSVRFKRYGIEVRSPGNVWLKHRQWIRWVAETCKGVCGLHPSYRINILKIAEKVRGSATAAVDTADARLAEYVLLRLLERTGLSVPASEAEIREERYRLMHPNSVCLGEDVVPKPKTAYVSSSSDEWTELALDEGEFPEELEEDYE